MRANLLIIFLLSSTLMFGNEDKDVINKIDKINSLASEYYNNGEILKSFKEFITAKRLSDSIQDYYGSATANFNLGNIYYLMEKYESAKDYYQQTLSASMKIKDNYLTSCSYLNLGKIYREENASLKSIQFFNSALDYARINGYTNESDKLEIKNTFFEARINLCEIYIENEELDKALIELLKLNDFSKANVINIHLQAYYKYLYGKYYAEQELYNNANIKFKEAVSLLEENNLDLDLSLLGEIYMQMSISLAKSGKSSEAYIALLTQNSHKNRLQNQDKNKQDLILKSKFLIEDYKNNASKANADRLQQLAVANKLKKINYAIFLTLLLLVASLVVVYSSYKSKIKLSKTLKVKNSELEIARNDALKSSELKSNFISNVSHELRTPLYGVVGITSMLLENNSLEEKDRKHLKSLKYSGDYLLNLINDILQVGKIEANKIELKMVSVNLKTLLEDIVDSFNYRLEETDNDIKLSIDNRVPEYIKCDKVRLSQVLINLIGNSVKFTSNGVINLRVKLLELNNDDVTLNFEVEDNGIGIAKEKFDIIFDNFSQLDDSNVNYQGTGLGLSITKQLVNLFNSEIKLQSEVGVGTKVSFEVALELDKGSTERITAFASSKKEQEFKVPNNKYSILVAEDNKINQVVTKNLLKKNGYECTIVSNGKEALEAVKFNKYDLVLMDINMPIMDGNEATVKIREFNKRIPIIALTASDIDEIAQNCEDHGYDDIILKPFDNYEFFQIINFNIQNSKKNLGVELITAS